MADDAKENRLSLKWGTLKSWHFHTETGKTLLKEYHEIGASMSAMTQRDTPRQKEIICELIDKCPEGSIYLDWDGIEVTREEAKKYVLEYER